MSLTEQIQKDIVTAMKAKDEARLSTLRMVKSALQNRKIEKMAELDEKESQAVLATLIKQRKESVEQFTKGGRQEMADKEAAEIVLIETYMPKSAGEAEIVAGVKTAIAEMGAPTMKEMGTVMKNAMARFNAAGMRVDGKVVSEAVKKELAAGYQRIKIKIKPGMDLEQIKRLRQDFPRIKLMVDANSAYRPADLPLLQQFEPYHLMMIEQPLGWDDLYGHVELQKKLQTPICLDECIHTLEQAQAAIALGACKIINIKMGRVGGYTVAKEIHDLCQANSIPVWCGGMLESGIGRAHNIAISTLANFTLPGDVTASARYWHEDIIEPEVTVSAQGTIRVPSGPGIGFAPRMDRIEKFTVRKERLA